MSTIFGPGFKTFMSCLVHHLRADKALMSCSVHHLRADCQCDDDENENNNDEVVQTDPQCLPIACDFSLSQQHIDISMYVR